MSSYNQHCSTQSNNYEILEECILLNELVNISLNSNLGDEHQSSYNIKIKKMCCKFYCQTFNET